MPAKTKLSDRTATRLLEAITLEKRFSTGDKLPNENDLCAEFGVSRTTLRSAIQKLVMQNILTVERGVGTFVTLPTGHDPNSTIDTLSFAGVHLKDLYETRLLIEPGAARYCAQRASDDELDQIIRYCGLIVEKFKADEDTVEANRLFHNAIALASHNTMIAQLAPAILGETAHLFCTHAIVAHMHEYDLDDHQLITSYLKMRDPAGAEAAMRLHLMHSLNDYGLLD